MREQWGLRLDRRERQLHSAGGGANAGRAASGSHQLGRILPANPLSLPASPPGVTGIFGAHVVVVDAASVAVIGATLGGWSCVAPGPARFDGTYAISHLPVGHSYQVYVEPMDDTVYPSLVSPATATLCRNPMTDAGWPPLQACVVPTLNTGFTARTRPGN
jgi:hypothetical protein